MLPGLTLVLGGAASGKSAFAEGLVINTGRQRTYLATAEIYDTEMQAKVAKHQEMRGTNWHTIEVPLDPGRVLATVHGEQVVLLDCATMWLSNQLLAENDLVQAEFDLMQGLALCAAPVVIVSNETGLGIVPDNALARRFRQEQGLLNQRLAAKAGLVVNVIAGLPQVLKGTLP
ncbi:bifunctional adenosylcobinamide kinase/adenosylcobinamide-phosphate guanylyltransferase [Roseovarius sp. EL26]|uniref:bifunctional adenosylcobinamide kinase/adenosylcobinamide-phosphate guanylyltransferase n=1 Tax=Roseovarius sp. EL26 TaxID=2126672 RepID=UPI000EA31B92|nr:bifunctional adenosylcobinamide kinase/adenosylcobinamide-phosphate guanylyltransferase [Roseovarius sp. EL26]